MALVHNCRWPLFCRPDSAVSDKDPPVKRLRSEEGEDSEEELLSSDEEDDHVSILLEAGSAFMETAFKSQLNATSRRKKMVKLGLLSNR